MDFLTRDLRVAARALFRTRGFLLLVVVAIALGIGANTTVFSVLNTLVLKPLPFPRAGELVYLDEQSPHRGTGEWMSTSYPDFQDWRAQSRSFRGMAAFQDAAFDLAGPGGAERTSGAVVSADLFNVLRARAAVGRALAPADGAPSAPPVVVLGHGLWSRRFGGDAGVVGKTILVNGEARVVVGVMPAGLRFPEFAELWVPLREGVQSRRDGRTLAVVGRLAPGATIATARAELATINWRLSEAYPESNDGVTLVVKPLHEALRGETSEAAVLFQGITLLVLLIAWANVANLLLVRSLARRKEIAIRAALGASRRFLLRQLLAEGVVLAVLGGGAGLLLGLWGRNLLVSAIPIELPFWVSFDFDWRVLAFAAGVSTVSVLFFAAAPAAQLRRLDIQSTLKGGGGGRGGTGDARGGRMQGGLVVAETALALVLMICAGLMAKSLFHLQRIDPGFQAERVATSRLSLPAARYPDAARREALWTRLLDEVAALPGVEVAAVVTALPLSGGSGGSAITVEGHVAEAGKEPFALSNTVSPDYFRVMGIPLHSGRAFRGAERGAPSVIVNRAMAERFWPGDSPVGKRVKFGSDADSPWREVVGVVGDVKDSRLANPTWPTVYLPYSQSSVAFARLVVRTPGDPAAVVGPVREAVRGVDPEIPLDQSWTMPEVVSRSMWLSRLYAWLAGVFAVMALVLSATGMYGLLGYMVRQRTREIGIRAALGARPRDVTRLFVNRGMRLGLIAVAVGLPVSGGVARLLSALLYGMGATDLVVFAGVPLLMLGVALVASFIPAHAAARVEPSVALRHD
ncbi:MAG TPA: ABC transporter permease [Longimicrobium sp.]